MKEQMDVQIKENEITLHDFEFLITIVMIHLLIKD